MTDCATAACGRPATAVHDGWPACPAHAVPEREDRARDFESFELLREWVGRLHHVGLTDAEVAAVAGVAPCTARAHRRALGLPTNRTDRQRAHDDRLACEGDARVSRCGCAGWRWDGECGSCEWQRVAS